MASELRDLRGSLVRFHLRRGLHLLLKVLQNARHLFTIKPRIVPVKRIDEPQNERVLVDEFGRLRHHVPQLQSNAIAGLLLVGTQLDGVVVLCERPGADERRRMPNPDDGCQLGKDEVTGASNHGTLLLTAEAAEIAEER